MVEKLLLLPQHTSKMKNEKEVVAELQPKELTVAERAQQLKAKHKVDKIFRLSTTDETGNAVEGWVRKPGFADVGMFTTVLQQDKVKAMKLLINTIWLEGDKAITEDIDCFMSIMSQVNKIVEVRKSELEKF